MLKQELANSAYFAAENFALFNNDSLELLQRLDEDSVDLIFADPPYNLSNNGFTVQSGRRVSVNKGSWDESGGVENDFAFHRAWIAACYRALKPQATIVISGTYH